MQSIPKSFTEENTKIVLKLRATPCNSVVKILKITLMEGTTYFESL
jgi:hypothetical protein